MTTKNEAFSILGLKAEDLVTGFKGVVTSISFDLYGCVQATLTAEAKDPKADDKYLSASYWFDLKRLKVTSKAPVMVVPTFEYVPGPENKPNFNSLPRKD